MLLVWKMIECLECSNLALWKVLAEEVDLSSPGIIMSDMIRLLLVYLSPCGGKPEIEKAGRLS